jgi:hypothetical protein
VAIAVVLPALAITGPAGSLIVGTAHAACLCQELERVEITGSRLGDSAEFESWSRSMSDRADQIAAAEANASEIAVAPDGTVPADVQEATRAILKLFWPTRTPPAVIDQRTADFAAKVLAIAVKSTGAMDFVPRPAGFMPGLSWLATQAVATLVRAFSGPPTSGPQIYDNVKVVVANNFAIEYDLILRDL